jgi:hypothetical protein
MDCLFLSKCNKPFSDIRPRQDPFFSPWFKVTEIQRLTAEAGRTFGKLHLYSLILAFRIGQSKIDLVTEAGKVTPQERSDPEGEDAEPSIEP